MRRIRRGSPPGESPKDSKIVPSGKVFERDGEYIAIRKEKHTMHILFSPIFANVIWIGGGSVGLLLVIVILVLLFRG
jgi:hypothetical protein